MPERPPEPEPEAARDGAAEGATQPRDLPSAAALSDQELEAQRLHAELAQVRELLDAPLRPARPAAGAASRRGLPWIQSELLIGIVIALVLVLLLALVLIRPWRDGRSNGAGPGAGTGAAATALDPQLSALGLPGTGPGVSAPGVVFTATVRPDLSISVVERGVFPAGLENFTIGVASGTPLQRDGTGLNPYVDDLKAEVDGNRATASPRDSRTWTVTTANGPARTVLLEYELRNSIVLSDQSAAGRALGRITPLLTGLALERGQPVAFRLPAKGLLNVTCTDAPKRQLQCSRVDGTTKIGRTPKGSATANILLLIDLRAWNA